MKRYSVALKPPTVIMKGMRTTVILLLTSSLLWAKSQTWLSLYAKSCAASSEVFSTLLEKKITLEDAHFLCRLGQEEGVHPETLAFLPPKDKHFATLLKKFKKKGKGEDLASFLQAFAKKEKLALPEKLSFPFFSYQKVLERLGSVEIPTLPPVEMLPSPTYAYPLSFEASPFFTSFTSFMSPSLMKNFHKLPRNPFPE